MQRDFSGFTATILCFISIASIAVYGCGHRPETRSSSSGGVIADDGGEYCTGVARPPWVPKPNMEHPDVIYATGVALQAPSRQEGRALAFKQGAGQLTKGLCGDSALQQDYLEAEYCERHGSGVDYYVLVALPRSRYEAMRRQCAHTVLIGGLCPACPDASWVSDVAGVLSSKGLRLAPETLAQAQIESLLQGNRKAAASLGESKHAAVAVTVSLALEKKLVEDDIHSVYLRAEARIIELEHGAALHTLTIPAVKGAAFDEGGAWKKATSLISQELRNRLAPIRI